MLRTLLGTAVLSTLVACSGGSSSTGATEPDPPSTAAATDDPAPSDAPAPDDPAASTSPGADDPAARAGDVSGTATFLSAYHGLDALPAPIIRLCRSVRGVRQDGMPVTFSVQLDDATVTPGVFEVETASGEVVTPVCATLRPADEPLELRTVLLAGPFGTPEAPPRAVRVVGALQDTDGNALQGLSTTDITPLAAGPSVVLAERFTPTTPGLAGECPAATQQVVQLTWQGGVTGPNGADLAEPQRTAVTVTLADGNTVTPVALADDDPDNFVHACLDVATPAASVAVAAGFFHDPGDDANPATEIEVAAGVP